MKVNISLLLLALSAVHALPPPVDSAVAISSIDTREPHSTSERPDALWKRKGGGGSGGKGGGGGTSSGGSSSGGSSSGSRGGAGSSSSSAGGRTTTGSGVTPKYAGGRYYGGGATVPYSAGARSGSGIAPAFFLGGAAAFAFFPAVWLYGVYSYPYVHPYSFRNASANNANQTKPVNCLCEQYSECGCDENGDQSYLGELVGNGSYSALNQSLVTVADINGTSTILVNGTLPNGTTASGGTSNPFDDGAASLMHFSGYWLMAAFVGCTVFLA